MPDTRLILHVKGTENQTAEIPKNIVRAGIAQGQISRSQLIWSAAHNAWKQVRELPHLLPSQKLAPAPAPRVGTVPLPQPAEREGQPAVAAAATQTGSVPKVRVAARSGPPGFKAATGVKAAEVAPADDHLVVEEKGGFSYMKWFCIGLTLLIVVLLAANYLLVDRPIVSQMSQTEYKDVPVYAHLAAFVQPNELLIHIPPSAKITSANLPSFLQVLAHSTAGSPLGGSTYDHVVLTTAWTGHYCFTGYAWKELGDMADQDDEHKQGLLLDQLQDASGNSVLPPSGNIDANAEQMERDKVWTEFVNYFTAR